ncbi:MAG TPA: type II secretion system F family protein [Bacteroidia bacterium]|nr:type II secretion system F family protein [Bacteroidia bacterium]
MNKIDLKNIAVSRSQTGTGRDVKEPATITKLLNREISFLGKKFDNKRKEWFYSELSILLSAGVDTKAALELIVEEARKGREKIIFETLLSEVINGKNVSQVLRNFPEFSSYEYHSIEIGEETGQLTEVLQELALFYEGQVKLKRQIVSTLSYPMVVVLIAFGTVYFMLTTVVPMFKDIFKRVGGDLPESTKLMIALSNKFTSYAGFAILIIAGISFTLYMQRKQTWYRNFFSRLILKTPVLGGLVAKIYLTRFCHSMKLLLRSKTKLIDAIELVEKMIDFYPIEIALKQVREDILKGNSLYESLSSHTIFSRRMVSLIKVAEEVNQSDLIFEKLAIQLSDEVDHQNAVIGKLIEPIFIIVLGLMIGFILVSMYLPLFQLSTSVGG